MQKLLNEWRIYLKETAEGLPSFSYSQAAIDLIKHYESFRSKPYDDKCPPNKPRGKDCKGTATIGYGTTKYPNGKKVTLQDKPVTEKQAERYLIHSMGFIIQGINKFMATKEKVDKKGNPIILNQNQIDALTSAGYNVGRSRLLNSQLYTVATRDPNNPKIRALFKTLNKPEEHKNFPGLMKRRMAEADLYFKPVKSINEKKKKTKVSKAGQERVSKKIALLIKKEKMKPKQATAVAYSMEKRGELKKSGKHSVA